MFSLRHGTFMKVFKNFGLLAGHCETVGAQIKMVSNNMFGTYTIYEIHKGKDLLIVLHSGLVTNS
jgi:hypothetical protein